MTITTNSFTPREIVSELDRYIVGQDDAKRAVEFVLKGDPDNGRAWFIAALIHRRTEDVLSAEACLRNALRLSPRADGWVMLGQLLMVQSRFGEAEQALSKAEAMDPLDGGLHLARGDSLAVRGRFEEALPHYERSLEVDPSNWGGPARAKIVAAKQRIADQRK